MAPIERLAGPESSERTRVYVHHPRAADCSVRLSDDWVTPHRLHASDKSVSYFDVPDSAARRVEFKVTLGSEWSTGPNVPLRSAEVHVAPTFARGAGEVETLFHDFYSHTLNNHRDVRVYKPPGYDENPERRYPVVWFQDGQKVFTGHGNQPFGSWAAERALDDLIGRGIIPPVLGIAVDSLDDHRTKEYGPEGGRAYLHFLSRELKHEVDNWLRTRSDPDHQAMIGSSMGGWIALFAAHTEPALGNKVGALSTAAWPEGNLLARMIHRRELGVRPLLSPDARVWLDYGSAPWHPENDTNKVDNARSNVLLWEAYADRGLKNGKGGVRTTVFPIAEGQTAHSEPSWSQRLPEVLTFLAEPWTRE